jgi:hypothetical protein
MASMLAEAGIISRDDLTAIVGGFGAD